MDKKAIKELIENYSSPTYIFDINELKTRISFLKENLSKRMELCYAIKANTFIVKELEEQIERLEICSPGEYDICNEMNIKPAKMVISGVYKTPSAIEKMIEQHKDIGRFTVESIEQLRLLDELSTKFSIKLNILLRLTSGNQFGINEEDIEKIISEKEKYKYLDFVGIQYFSGTQKRTNKRLQKEIDYIDEFLEKLEKEYSYIANELEFGAGLPVFYFKGDSFDEKEFLKEFSKCIDNMNFRGKIIVELGRSISASCGYYATKIVDMKKNKDENYAILDGGINHLVYYGQTMAMKVPFYKIYDEKGIIKTENGNIEKWNLMGSLCTINDILVKQLPINNLNLGDVFIFENTGAYCITEGISLFLSRDLPQVMLLKDNKFEVVRNVIETYKFNMPIIKK